jgi:hypothetical protein
MLQFLVTGGGGFRNDGSWFSFVGRRERDLVQDLVGLVKGRWCKQGTGFADA